LHHLVTRKVSHALTIHLPPAGQATITAPAATGSKPSSRVLSALPLTPPSLALCRHAPIENNLCHWTTEQWFLQKHDQSGHRNHKHADRLSQ
jgi:hypothetical protein